MRDLLARFSESDADNGMSGKVNLVFPSCYMHCKVSQTFRQKMRHHKMYLMEKYSRDVTPYLCICLAATVESRYRSTNTVCPGKPIHQPQCQSLAPVSSQVRHRVKKCQVRPSNPRVADAGVEGHEGHKHTIQGHLLAVQEEKDESSEQETKDHQRYSVIYYCRLS